MKRVAQSVRPTGAEPLVIDGSHGEGGGQILRTALTLAAVTGRWIRIEKIRARRPKPGLAAQHLTAIRAVAAMCRARLEGDALGSAGLEFAPRAAVQAGDYRFDVAAESQGGSAGSAGLILQAAVLPLALAAGTSRVAVRGGTHVPWSPTFDYLRDVWCAALEQIGIAARTELVRSGWYPVGQGEIRAEVSGLGPNWREQLRPVSISERGKLTRIAGRALAANLPEHIPERMAERSRSLLKNCGAEVRISPLSVRAACPGAGIFLLAEYERVRCGFSALGKPGKPAEEVAEDAVWALMAHRVSEAALDLHLADQILVPLALASGPSSFSAERITGHLETNAWVIEQFGLARISTERWKGRSGLVTVGPR